MWTLPGSKWLHVVLGASALGLSLGIAAPSAEAGQPWSCTCQGKTKRFIASTKACERAQPKNRNIKGMGKLIPCTRAEFTAWNRNACAQEGCTLVGAKSRY